MKYLHKFSTLTLLASAAGLTVAGCGGGDGGSPLPQQTQQTASTRFAAEGFWSGPAPWINMSLPVGATLPSWSSGQADFWGIASFGGTYAGLVVLPTGETWGVYTSSGSVTGALHGQAQVTGSNVAITSQTFDSWGMLSANYSGSVTPSSQLDLTSHVATPQDVSLTTAYDPHYDQAASLYQLAGSYTGTGGAYTASSPSQPSVIGTGSALNTLGSAYAVTISSTGVVTLPPDPLGCSGAGTATPRTDSNVFNLSIRFSGSQCVLGDGATVNGIAVVENGHLLMMATPPSGSNPSGEFVYVSN